MSAPRLEIDLEKIHDNARSLVVRLARRGISVTGVTKATLGSPEVSSVLVRAGVSGLGDSRIENIENMAQAGVSVPMSLVRSPMLSQVDRVVKHAAVSFNTELDTLSRLSSAAQKAGGVHGVVLMVELGDLREGIMPGDLENTVRRMLQLPNLELEGIGTNLACRHGVSPDAENMAELSALAGSVETAFGGKLRVVSGGNSGNLRWALGGASIGRINNLRLGESLLLGREPLYREPIEGLSTDAITLVAEVIESKFKPSQPWGALAQSAFGETLPGVDHGEIAQTTLAVGQQDTDPAGLQAPAGMAVLDASSDHLVTDTGGQLMPIGSEVTFQLNYSALLRAMTSPFVRKVLKGQSGDRGLNGPALPAVV